VILADPRDENDYEDESMDGVLVRLFEGERQVFFDGREWISWERMDFMGENGFHGREWISWERMDFMGENGFHGRENGVLGDSRSVPHNRNCE
jgi:hypothetical protein